MVTWSIALSTLSISWNFGDLSLPSLDTSIHIMESLVLWLNSGGFEIVYLMQYVSLLNLGINVLHCVYPRRYFHTEYSGSCDISGQWTLVDLYVWRFYWKMARCFWLVAYSFDSYLERSILWSWRIQIVLLYAFPYQEKVLCNFSNLYRFLFWLYCCIDVNHCLYSWVLSSYGERIKHN